LLNGGQTGILLNKRKKNYEKKFAQIKMYASEPKKIAVHGCRAGEGDGFLAENPKTNR
jgi:hypothetical protein